MSGLRRSQRPAEPRLMTERIFESIPRPRSGWWSFRRGWTGLSRGSNRRGCWTLRFGTQPPAWQPGSTAVSISDISRGFVSRSIGWLGGHARKHCETWMKLQGQRSPTGCFAPGFSIEKTGRGLPRRDICRRDRRRADQTASCPGSKMDSDGQCVRRSGKKNSH